MKPRFVLLRHECPPQGAKPSHWDFMLEVGGRLQTWEIRVLPTAWAASLGECSPTAIAGAAATTAHQLPDHRLAYLDFEGPLSGDRGSVRCCDRGNYDLLRTSEQMVEVMLSGNLLHGSVRLTRDGPAWSIVPMAGDS